MLLDIILKNEITYQNGAYKDRNLFEKTTLQCVLAKFTFFVPTE